MSWSRFIVGFDVHGDQQDPGANSAYFKFHALWKPSINVCGGDLFDFRPLRAKANEDERRESMRADFEAGLEWLERNKTDYFLLGNHDVRLWRLRDAGRGPLSDLAGELIRRVEEKAKKIGCKILPYDKRAGVLRLGSLKIIHGFYAGVTAARRTAQAYGSVLMGHGHGIQHVSIEGVENRVGRMCGCLCQLDMEYVQASIASLLWRHGWAYGVINDRTGAYQVWQAEGINGKWILPTGVKEL